MIHMSTQEIFDPYLQEMYKPYEKKNKGIRVQQDPGMCADFAKASDPKFRSDHRPTCAIACT